MAKLREIPAFVSCIIAVFIVTATARAGLAASSSASLDNYLNQTSTSLKSISVPSSIHLGVDLNYDSYLDANTTYFDSSEKSSAIQTVGVTITRKKAPYYIQTHAFYAAQENTPYFDVAELSGEIKRTGYNLFIGRHLEEWSSADSFWRFGYWQPKFAWNGLRPTEDGLTGLFFEPHTGSRIKMTFFASGLYQPETDPSYQTQNNALVSKNPWFQNPPRTIGLWSVPTPVHMSVDTPSIASVALKPSAGYKLDWQMSSISSLHVAYAYKPMNTPVLAYQYHDILDPTNYMDVVVEPQFDYHHIGTVENSWELGDVSLTSSLTYDSPVITPVSNEWIAQNLAPSWIGSLTANWQIRGNPHQRLYGGGMNVWGNFPGDRGDNAQATTQFNYRPLYLSAMRIGYAAQFDGIKNRKTGYSIEATYDPRLDGAQLLNELDYSWDQSWQASARADLLGIFAEPTTFQKSGFFATYRSNSMASLDVSYVF